MSSISWHRLTFYNYQNRYNICKNCAIKIQNVITLSKYMQHLCIIQCDKINQRTENKLFASDRIGLRINRSWQWHSKKHSMPGLDPEFFASLRHQDDVSLIQRREKTCGPGRNASYCPYPFCYATVFVYKPWKMNWNNCTRKPQEKIWNRDIWWPITVELSCGDGTWLIHPTQL